MEYPVNQDSLQHPRFQIDPLAPGVLWDWKPTPGEVKMSLWDACEAMSDVVEMLASLQPPEQIGLN